MKPQRQHITFLSFLLFASIIVSSCSGFDEQLMYNQAQRAHNKRDFATAIALYEKLLESDPENKINPDNAIIHYDLGVAYIDAKRPELAQKQVAALKKLKRKDLAQELEKLVWVSDAVQ